MAGLALALLAIEAALAASLVEARFSRLLVLFVGAAGAAFVFRFPWATALALLACTDFIFHPAFFTYPLGPIDVRPYELALAGLVVVAVVRPQRRTWGGLPGLALAIFLGVVALSGVLAIASERAELTDVFNWGRPLGLLLVFYVVIRLFPSPDQRRLLLTGAAVLAALTGVVALLVSFGWGVGDALQGPGNQAVREQEGLGPLQRVRLPGLSIGYALFWYAAARIAASRGLSRLGWSVLLGGIALDIVVSFNRNMWFGLAVGLLLLLVVGGAYLRHRLAVAIAVAAAAAMLVAAFGASTGDNRLLDPVIQRGSSILEPEDVSRESSFQDRERETRVAWDTATSNLGLGVGVGADFGLFNDHRIGANSFVRVPQLFLHNQYLYLLLIGGLPALIAFLVFLGVPVVSAFRRSPGDPAIAACATGIVLIMISSIVALYFTVEDMTTVLGLLTGTIVADRETRAAAGLDSGLLG